jgi:hypothetical protein
MKKKLENQIFDLNENQNIKIHQNDNLLELNFDLNDNIYTLSFEIPNLYPFESLSFFITSVGTDKMTISCLDKIRKEFSRAHLLRSVISTWTSVITHATQDCCPICQHVLNEEGKYPRVKCHFCKKAIHRNCLMNWLKKSLKRDCPWWRAKWKKERKQKSNSSSPKFK